MMPYKWYLFYVTSQQACETFLRFCHFPDEEMGVQEGWLEADSNLVYQFQSQGSKVP